MKKHILIAATAAVLSLPLALSAADEKKKGGAFAAADKDSDGKVTKVEFVAALSERLGGEAAANARFAELDKDKDGSLSRQEFNAGMGGGKKGDGEKKNKKTDAN